MVIPDACGTKNRRRKTAPEKWGRFTSQVSAACVLGIRLVDYASIFKRVSSVSNSKWIVSNNCRVTATTICRLIRLSSFYAPWQRLTVKQSQRQLLKLKCRTVSHSPCGQPQPSANQFIRTKIKSSLLWVTLPL